MDRRGRDKRDAMAFYDLMFDHCQPAGAIARYAGATYLRYDPGVGDGEDAFIDSFARMAREYPGKRVGFERASAEGDLVALRRSRTGPGGHDHAGSGSFRPADDGKIVGHRDVPHVIADRSANANGMFRFRATIRRTGVSGGGGDGRLGP